MHLHRRASCKLLQSKFQIPHLVHFSEYVIVLVDPGSFLQPTLSTRRTLGIHLKGVVDGAIVDLEWIVILIIAFECDSNVRLAP